MDGVGQWKKSILNLESYWFDFNFPNVNLPLDKALNPNLTPSSAHTAKTHNFTKYFLSNF